MFVLDASVAIAWVFEDEKTPQTDALFRDAWVTSAIVPEIWPLEVTNVLLTAERRKRLSAEKREEYARVFASLPVGIVETPAEEVFDNILPLAHQERLTTYDATYLHLAMRLKTSLATLDEALRNAAQRNGVEVLPN